MDKILDEVKGASSIGISGHIRPDGDCVGSTLAMYMYLKKALPEDTVIDIILEQPSEIFACIKGYDEISKYPRRQAYDVFIAIDCDKSRLGDALPGYEKAKKTINIDHHLSNPCIADVNYVYPEVGSASELVYDLLDDELVDVDIAKAIYIGIIHDTGVMQYSSTSPKTLRTVADLIAYGFDFTSIIDETFYQKSYTQNRLMGQALIESELLLNDKLIVAHMTLETLKANGVSGKDLDGIVSQLRYTRGVEVAMFMYELEHDKWKVSLRGNSDLNLAKVAELFDGGGHAKASGCTLVGQREEVVSKLSQAIESAMKNGQ